MRMTVSNRSTVILVGVLMCLDSSSAELPTERRPERSPEAASANVVLITVSSLRADHISGFGYERCTTPEFDRFARENVWFSHAFASSGWMMPAHGSIFTSLFPRDHGATHIDRHLDGRCQTIAEILAEHGYYCAGFCCGPRLGREYGFAQGFHFYDDYSVSMILEGLESDPARIPDINRRRTNDLINDAAISWLRKNTHKPFFLFVHYYDNHWDYLPPPPYRDMYDPNYDGSIDGTQIAREPLYSNVPSKRDIGHMVALYDGEVRQTDHDLGDMLDVLESQGLFDNSIVIVLGDHGEQFYEHGNTSHHGLYDELIGIPLAISFPEGKRQEYVVDALVSHYDILPTVLDYLSIPIPSACYGKSLKPLVEGRVNVVHPLIYAEYTGGAIPDVFVARSLQYKCFCTGYGGTFGYDLLADPGEQHQIEPKDFPAELDSLAAALDGMRPTLPTESADADR